MTSDIPVPANQSGSVQATEEDALPEIAWPRWEWVLGMRGIAVATMLGVLSYFTPLLTREVPRWAWLTVGTILVLL